MGESEKNESDAINQILCTFILDIGRNKKANHIEFGTLYTVLCILRMKIKRRYFAIKRLMAIHFIICVDGWACLIFFFHVLND